MDLGIVMQSEISQKEKNKYCILNIYVDSEKIGTNNLIYKAEIGIQT